MDETEKLQLLTAVWPRLNPTTFQSHTYTALLSYFKEEIVRCRAQLPSSTATQISLIISSLNRLDSQSMTKTTALQTVKVILGDTGDGDNSATQLLDVALRLMSTLDIQSGRNSRVLRNPFHATFASWPSHSTALVAVDDHFMQRRTEPAKGGSGKLDPSMTMAYLCSYRNFTLRWTSNLADHLMIDWKYRIIHVYEHKICLWNHLKSDKEQVVPRGILNEAIDTLNLLFPLDDKATKKLLEGDEKTFNGLGYCGRSRLVKLEQFNIWKYQIAELVEVMNEEPRGLGQLRLDKDGRNLLPFATFWMAAAVAILTVISIVFGVASTVYGVKQYDLALAQACAMSNAAELLPQYCT